MQEAQQSLRHLWIKTAKILCARVESSIRQTMVVHHDIERQRDAASRAYLFQFMLGQAEIFDVLQVLENSLARMVGSGLALTLARAVETRLDVSRQLYSDMVASGRKRFTVL